MMKKDKNNIIPFEMGIELQKEINAIQYIECSSKTKNNLKFLFDEALRLSLIHISEPTRPY